MRERERGREEKGREACVLLKDETRAIRKSTHSSDFYEHIGQIRMCETIRKNGKTKKTRR